MISSYQRKNAIRFIGLAIVICGCFFGCKGSAVPEDEKNGQSSTLTITYVDENGTELGTQQVDNSSSAQTVYFNYEKEGYISTFFDSEGNQIYSGTFITTKNCTITVKNTPITYTVKFAKSSQQTGTISGTLPDDMLCTYDVEYTMPENNLTYVSYTTTYKSAGWTATDSSSKVYERGEYSGGANFKNLSKTNGNTVTLYACFTTADCYSLKFYTYGTNGTYNTVYADAGLVPINSIPKAADKKGYSFDGWYLSTDSNETVIDFSTYKVTGDASFYPKYSLVTYTVTFETAHGTAPTPVTYTYSTSGYINLSDSTYVIENVTGYDFAGWCIGDNTYTSSFLNYTTAKDVTLTAKWTTWTATLKFDENSTTAHPVSGGYAMTNQTLTWGEETTLPPVSFYCTSGFVFDGWNQKADGSGSTTWPDKGTIKWEGNTKNQTITLYAQWKKLPISVSIKLADPVETDDIYLSYDSSTGLFTAALAGATSFEWYIDGEKIAGQVSSNFSSAYLTEGVHTITVMAEVNGNLYSMTRAVVVSLN